MKKIINFVLISLLLVGITGCNSKNDYSDNYVKNQKDTQIYYCKEVNDDDSELFFYYEDNNLVSLDFSNWYDYEDFVEEVKNLAKEYNNVTYDKIKGEASNGEISDRLRLTVDFTKDGMTFQEFDDLFKDVTDPSWENVKIIMEDNGYTCSLKD